MIMLIIMAAIKPFDMYKIYSSNDFYLVIQDLFFLYKARYWLYNIYKLLCKYCTTNSE